MHLIPYIRVSTDDQAEHGHSMDAQRGALERWAGAGGHTLAACCVDDGVSASRPLDRRAGGAQLLQQLRDGLAQGVVVTRMDRLFRDLFDALAFFREAAERGWVVVSQTEHVDTSTPAGRLMLHMMLATAQYERELASVRTAAVSASLRERGRVYGTTPYGCVAVDGQLLRCPQRWPVREQIVAWHRADRLSLRTIRGLLHDMRVTAPSGGRSWPVSTIAGVLDTHDSLSHLPMQHQSADGAQSTTETEVSP